MSNLGIYQSILNQDSLNINAGDLAISGLTSNKPLYLDANNLLASISIGSGLIFTAPTLSIDTAQIRALISGTSPITYSSTTGAIGLNTSALSTDDIKEGSTNLYYTTARVDSWLATRSTTNLAEGTNLYYTTARVDSWLTTKSTSNLAEGTNLYYTTARARSAISGTAPITYNSTTGAIGLTVASIDHNSLANLTTGNPHSQYVLGSNLTNSTLNPAFNTLTVAGVSTLEGITATIGYKASVRDGVYLGSGAVGTPYIKPFLQGVTSNFAADELHINPAQSLTVIGGIVRGEGTTATFGYKQSVRDGVYMGSGFGAPYTRPFIQGVTNGFATHDLFLNPAGGNVLANNLAINGASQYLSSRLAVAGSIWLPQYSFYGLLGGNSNGFLYGCFNKYYDGIHIGYNFYNNNTLGAGNVIPNSFGATSRITMGYGVVQIFTGGINTEPTIQGYSQDSVGTIDLGVSGRTTTVLGNLTVNQITNLNGQTNLNGTTNCADVLSNGTFRVSGMNIGTATYARMSFKGLVVTQALSTTYAKLAIFDTDEESSGITPSAANDLFTNSFDIHAGVYQLTFTMRFGVNNVSSGKIQLRVSYGGNTMNETSIIAPVNPNRRDITYITVIPNFNKNANVFIEIREPVTGAPTLSVEEATFLAVKIGV